MLLSGSPGVAIQRASAHDTKGIPIVACGLLGSGESAQMDKGGTCMVEMVMKHRWFLMGAVVLGIAIVVYLIFFCPTECH